MKMQIPFLAVALFAFCINAALAQESTTHKVSYTIDPAHVVNRIDEKVYGHFFEHIYHSANGGLWGELVWNRSFEENDGGQWQIADGVVTQAGMGTDQRLMFGDASWTDYEFTLEAQKTGGSEGFLILFRETNPDAHYWHNLGGWGNTRHQLENASPGRSRGAVGPAVNRYVHVGALYKDKNGNGILDGADIVLQAGPDPLHASRLKGSCFRGAAIILRPPQKE